MRAYMYLGESHWGEGSGLPGDAEMMGQRRQRGVVIAERIGGPPDRSPRQHCPRRRDRMLLGKRRRGTTRLEASPDSAQPAHHRRPAQAGRVVQHSAAAVMSDREPPASRTASRAQANQTRPSAPAAANHRLNFGHVHGWNVEHRIGPGAPARTRATHTVGIVGAFVRLLGRI
jgi:hypothetical protein